MKRPSGVLVVVMMMGTMRPTNVSLLVSFLLFLFLMPSNVARTRAPRAPHMGYGWHASHALACTHAFYAYADTETEEKKEKGEGCARCICLLFSPFFFSSSSLPSLTSHFPCVCLFDCFSEPAFLVWAFFCTIPVFPILFFLLLSSILTIYVVQG